VELWKVDEWYVINLRIYFLIQLTANLELLLGSLGNLWC